jgi:chromosome partitioning protein
MGIIVSTGNLKGGVGKSTLTLGLAGVWQREKKRVLVVDADSGQGTARFWSDRAAQAGHRAPSVVNYGPPKAMTRQVLAEQEKYDVILLDLPPRLGGETTAAMAISTVLLMPLAPSPADVWALTETLGYLETSRGFNPDLCAVAVWNRVDRSSLSRSIAVQLESEGVDVAQSCIRERVAHREAMMLGKAVVDYAPSSDAALDLRRLAAEIWKLGKATS